MSPQLNLDREDPMTGTATAKQRWLSALWPFVRAHLPPAPSRVLEIGCGPAGGFVPALRERGYLAVGVDPAAPSEPGYHQTEFERYEPAVLADAIVACASLHHVGDLDHVLDRAEAALAPGGVLIVVEWAYEKFDEATARWCFDRLPGSGEQDWLRGHREQWLASDQPWHTYLDAWARRERLHRGHAIIQALQARFHTRLLTRTPYFFPDLYPTRETDEQAAADSGEIRATGIRYVAAKPAVTVTPVGTVHNGRPDPGHSDHWGAVESTILIQSHLGDRTLTGLAGFSHVEVVFLLDRLPEREDYRQPLRPRGRTDLPAVGVFADRGPRRPNRIGCTICEVLSAHGQELRVRGLDAVDGTPVLDIKPVMREFLPGRVRQPEWAGRLMAEYFSR
jgi:tRNA (Thr-GGU) A37 N-methylase/SAM-dependent methyltransferase